MQLRPGKGLGDLKFGMLPATVVSILGQPDRIFEADGEEDEFIYQYNELRTMCTFYKHENERLGYIRSSNPAITFAGELLLDQPIKQMLEGPLQQIKGWQMEKYDFFDTCLNEKNWIVLNIEYDRITDIEIGMPLDGDDVYVWL